MITAKVTPGITLNGSQAVDEGQHNAGFRPTVTLEGGAGTAQIENNAVTPEKLALGNFFWGLANQISPNVLQISVQAPQSAPVEGMVIAFKSPINNTGDVTIQVTTTAGNFPNVFLVNRVNDELKAGDIREDQVIEMRYKEVGSGTFAWEMINEVGNVVYVEGTSEGTIPPAGSTSAYDLIPTPTNPQILDYQSGLVVGFKIHEANNDKASLNIHQIGARDLKKNGTEDLAAGDLQAGRYYWAIYDVVTTTFQILSPLTDQVVPVVRGVGNNIRLFNESGSEDNAIRCTADEIQLRSDSGLGL